MASAIPSERGHEMDVLPTKTTAVPAGETARAEEVPEVNGDTGDTAEADKLTTTPAAVKDADCEQMPAAENAHRQGPLRADCPATKKVLRSSKPKSMVRAMRPAPSIMVNKNSHSVIQVETPQPKYVLDPHQPHPWKLTPEQLWTYSRNRNWPLPKLKKD